MGPELLDIDNYIHIWIALTEPENLGVCEQEPIGPRETIQPGAEAVFTEEWHLLPMAFPGDGEEVDLAAFTHTVETLTAGGKSSGDGSKL